jgi:hypothetical protein
VRWAYFLALMLLIGGLGFRLLIVRGAAAAARRVALLQADGARVVAVLEVGIVAFLAACRGCAAAAVRDLLYGDLSPIAAGRASAPRSSR